ncbi:MAG: hypothetical protein HRT44_08025 [Bdellovibrionales bacterium]|nr:hypothetical protein [Bdellovibrionales bacterium]
MGLNNTDLTRYIKDDEEVDDYLRCHMGQVLRNERQRDARLTEYNQQVRPFVRHAVQSFQIPYALSACVMFRETFLNQNAPRSSAGAETIAQFTEDTFNDLRDSFNTLDRRRREKEEFDRMAADPNFDLSTSRSENFFVQCFQHATGEGIHVQMVSGTRIVPGTNITYREQSRRNCQTQLNDYYIDGQLDGELRSYLYNSSRGMTGDTRRRNFPNTPEGQWPSGRDLRPPRTFAEFQRSPMWIAALNMLYLKRMPLHADMYFNPEGFQASNDYLGLLTIIAGSYNRGPGRLRARRGSYQGIISKPNGSIRRYCEHLATVRETSNYMLSVKRCMARGSNYAVTGPGFQDSACPTNTGISNITNPCDQLLLPSDGRVYDLTDPNEPVICDSNLGQDCSQYTNDQ